jgi:uncharacterized membrane protein YfcA
LLWASLPSLLTAFVGGMIEINGHLYLILTGALLLITATLLLFGRRDAEEPTKPLDVLSLGIAGAGAGFLSGLTGVGGGVFLTPVIIAFGWMSPKRAAAFAPPFILGNSVFGLAGVIVSGQAISSDAPLLAMGALTGAIVGTHIGRRYLSDVGTRRVLAVVLVLAGVRLILRGSCSSATPF